MHGALMLGLLLRMRAAPKHADARHPHSLQQPVSGPVCYKRATMQHASRSPSHILLCLRRVCPPGEKPIVYDREWRMHMPNPNLLRVSTGSGPDAIPATLVDLVADCGEYSPAKRPSMREVSWWGGGRAVWCVGWALWW